MLHDGRRKLSFQCHYSNIHINTENWCIPTCMSGDEVSSRMAGRGAVHCVRGVSGVLVEANIVHAHLRRQVATALHSIRQGALALCSRYIVGNYSK